MLTRPCQLTKCVHGNMYPLLEHSRTELSAKGKTALVTEVSEGVGKAIAQDWVVAGATIVVLTGHNVMVYKPQNLVRRNFHRNSREEVIVVKKATSATSRR
ncbi:hypothetical protein F4809DRAFT_600467 [Biscogniauxia mediterranea]|nr:hypothetical protein F4809DRAFT_600467 [Biscogniauxia mediterranea]